MKIPADVAETIAELISIAVLRIRDAGWEGDAELCAIEADHVHNLPVLLLSFSPQLLEFYWNTERHSFINAAKAHSARKGVAADFRAFEKSWAVLEQRVRQQSKLDCVPIESALGKAGGTEWPEVVKH